MYHKGGFMGNTLENMYTEVKADLASHGIKRVVALDFETFYATAESSKAAVRSVQENLLEQAMRKYEAVLAPYEAEQRERARLGEEWSIKSAAHKAELAAWKEEDRAWKAYEAAHKAEHGTKTQHPNRRPKPEGPGTRAAYVPPAKIPKPAIKKPTLSSVKELMQPPGPYSLSDPSTTESYVRSPHFEMICVTITTDGDNVVHAWGEEGVRKLCTLMCLDDKHTMTVAHNARFEGFVLEQRLGVSINMLVCTMHMMRISGISRITSESLSSLAEFIRERGYQIPAKGTEVKSADGRHLSDIINDSEGFAASYLAYCAKDTVITYRAFMLMYEYVPFDSLALSNLTLQMYTRPVIELDADILRQYGEDEDRRREEALSKMYVRVGMESPEQLADALRSTKQVIEMLHRFGYDVPFELSAKATKDKELRLSNTSPCIEAGRKPNVSQRTNTPGIADEDQRVLTVSEKYINDNYYKSKDGKPPVCEAWEASGRTIEDWKKQPVYSQSLSKDNEEVTKQVLLHPCHEVREIIRLRLEYGSTKETKRAVKLLGIHSRGSLPFPVQMAGARTHRYTGDDKINLQNISKHKGEKLIRRAMVAKYGYYIGGADSSQVEARCLAYVANERDLVETFANNRDPYAMMASKIYGSDADEIVRYAKASDEAVEAMSDEEKAKYKECVFQRRVGKKVVLGCGYQMGKARFAFSLMQDNIYLTELDKFSQEGKDEHLANSSEMLGCYRKANPSIVAFWATCENVIRQMIAGGKGEFGGPNNDLFKYDGTRHVLGVHLPGIQLPSGAWLTYPNIREVKREEEDSDGNKVMRTKYMYTLHNGRVSEDKMLYGGSLTENLIQALAFAILAWQAVRIHREVPIAGNVHDEWFSVFKEEDLERVRDVYMRNMRAAPDFVKGLPLNCEFSYGKCYADM